MKKAYNKTMRLFLVLLLGLLPFLSTGQQHPSYVISQVGEQSVFTCYSLVPYVYADLHIQPFSIPVPSSRPSIIDLKSDSVSIEYSKGICITIFPELHNGFIEGDAIPFIPLSAAIEDTEFSFSHDALKTKRMNIKIKSNIGEVIVSGPPKQMGMVLPQLMGDNWESVSDIDNYIQVYTASKISTMAVFPNNDESGTDAFLLPGKCKGIRTIDKSTVAFQYASHSTIVISKSLESKQRIDSLKSPIEEYDIRFYDKRTKRIGDYYVTFFLNKTANWTEDALTVSLFKIVEL